MPGSSDNSGRTGGATDLIVRGKRVVTPDGERDAAIHIHHGMIEKISDFDSVPQGSVIYEARDFAVMPGLVDTHVHINEPGRTDWEGFVTATRAAAAGGVTTLIDMPLNSIPPTVSAAALRAKRVAAGQRVWVDTGFWGGAVPGNLGTLAGLHGAG